MITILIINRWEGRHGRSDFSACWWRFRYSKFTRLTWCGGGSRPTNRWFCQVKFKNPTVPGFRYSRQAYAPFDSPTLDLQLALGVSALQSETLAYFLYFGLLPNPNAHVNRWLQGGHERSQPETASIPLHPQPRPNFWRLISSEHNSLLLAQREWFADFSVTFALGRTVFDNKKIGPKGI